MEAKRKELQRLNGAYKNTLSNAKVTLLEGRGKIVGPHTVDVSAQTTEGERGEAVRGGEEGLEEVSELKGCGKFVGPHTVDVSGGFKGITSGVMAQHRAGVAANP